MAMLKDSVGVIEGEILDIWVNRYEYTTAFDKFEPGGLLYHRPTTVAYTIRIDNVLSGDFQTGDELTIEDFTFICDSVISIKKGSSYVIPIIKDDGMFYESDKILSGDTSLKYSYRTLYPYHPQIEKVTGGYIVPDDWTSLITDDCRKVTMDVNRTEFPNFDSLYYVPESIFSERIGPVINSR